jgi:mannosyltransferase OCH1-like enzyme
MVSAMIPRTLHMIWVGSPLPSHLARCVGSWVEKHPHWDHRLWGDSDLDWIPNRDIFDAAERLVPADAVGQFRADIARYAILERFGGLYVDVDTEALRCVDPALTGHTAFAAAEDPRWVGNTYLAAVAGHPVMRDLVDGIRESVARRRRGLRPNRLTGPLYLTPIWRAHGCHVAATDLWFPYSYRDVRRGSVPTDYGNAYAAHHWLHTRDLLEGT